MKNRVKLPALPEQLCACAGRLPTKTPAEIAQMSLEDLQKLVLEIQGQQTELERQNGQLRRTELELEKARDRYGDLYNFSPAAHLTLGADGEILEANLAAGKLLGLERDQLLHEKFTRFIPAEVQDKFHLLCGKVIRSNEGHGMDLELVTAQAKHLVIQVEATRDAEDSEGKCRLCLANITERKRTEDITERKQSELEQAQLFNTLEQQVAERTKSLKESFSLLRAAFESTADGLLIVDRSGRITDYNQQFVELWGLPEAVLATHDDRIALEFVLNQLRDPEAFSNKVRQLYDAPETSSFDLLEFKDGRVFERFSQPQWLDDTPVGRVWCFRDVTLQKQAEAALRRAHDELEERVDQRTKELQRSEERFRAVTDNLGDGILLTDREDIILDANPRILEMTGYARDEVTGRRGYEVFLLPEQFEEAKGRNAACLAGLSECYEILLRRKDGSRFWVEIACAPVRDGQGGIFGTVGVIRDIAERKNVQESLRRAHAELELRTHELAEANKKLEQEIIEHDRERTALIASEKLAATGRMAAHIAHEINNPLNGIISSFQILKNGIPPSHPDYSFVGLIERETQRIATIVRRMFSLYKRDSDPSTPFMLCQLICDVVKLSQPVAETRGVQLVQKLPETSIYVVLPEAALSEVLYNIVKNAVEASPKGGNVLVSLNTGDSKALITVADQGAGIAPELRERIFEPFFSTKQEPGQSGMGLGLSIVRTHVEAMGGRLWFVCPPSGGTVFYVELPRQETAVGGATGGPQV